jgi:hypothetical protein
MSLRCRIFELLFGDGIEVRERLEEPPDSSRMLVDGG